MYCLRHVSSPTTSLSICDFSYSCAAVDKISADIGSRSPCATAELLVSCGLSLNQQCQSTEQGTDVNQRKSELVGCVTQWCNASILPPNFPCLVLDLQLMGDH